MLAIKISPSSVPPHSPPETSHLIGNQSFLEIVILFKEKRSKKNGEILKYKLFKKKENYQKFTEKYGGKGKNRNVILGEKSNFQ